MMWYMLIYFDERIDGTDLVRAVYVLSCGLIFYSLFTVAQILIWGIKRKAKMIIAVLQLHFRFFILEYPPKFRMLQ